MPFHRIRFFALFLIIAYGFQGSAQITILSDPGPYNYNDIDGVETETFSGDISNCTSVSVSFDFGFSVPWEGSGNMESCDECPNASSPSCSCDVSLADGGTCNDCWDFLLGTVFIDGAQIFQDIVGEAGTTDADQFGSMNTGFVCTNGATDVDLEIMTNTWAGNETSTITNVLILCYQATATEIDTDTDLCTGDNVNLEGEALNNADVDTWFWSTDGGSTIDDDGIQNTFATGAVNGETYTLTTTDINGCSSTISETISLLPSPEASIDPSSDGELCFGECTSVSFNFVNGTPLYNLDLTFIIPGIGFPIDFDAPLFAVNDVITICYDIPNPAMFPSFDASTLTISVPEIAAGQNGFLTINNFTDANNCNGIVSGGAFTVSFLEIPEANDASLEECDEGGGTATFDLNEMDNIINGGSGQTVRYYGDPGLSTEIFSPYVSPSSVIYATVDNGECISPREPVNLIVLDNGDAGVVELYCSSIGNTECTICDDDTSLGEVIDILFQFNDPTLEHIVKLNITDDTGSSETTYTLNPNETSISFNITSNTTFEILEVTEGDGCVDITNLGDVVTVNYLISPLLDPIGPLSDCGSITLPPITGTNLDGSELYYTEANQGGDSYPAGTIITSSDNLFVFVGVPTCFDEITVDIEILPGTTFDEPNDTILCNPYTLPEITGTGINSTAAYFTLSGGNGDMYAPGNVLLSSITLFIFDPASQCSSNEPTFTITINDTPIIDVINIDTCGIYELPTITGSQLTGNETYFTEPNGMGMELMVGDTIFNSDTLYAYDNNNGCIADEEIIINVGGGPSAGVGDTIFLCKTNNTLEVNLPALLIEPADSLGIWSDDRGIIVSETDSTQVDLSGIDGEINFLYVIENTECGNDSSHVQINIEDQLDAGGEDLIIGCEGDLPNIDLNTFWNIIGINDTIIVLGGAGIDVTNPSMVNLNDLGVGIYNIDYIVGIRDTICTPDTANLTIEINAVFDAGENVFTTTCAGNVILLENVLQGNNTVGTFDDPNGTGALTGNEVDTGILGVGTFTFTHTVAANGSCLGETITIEIEVTNDVTAGEMVFDTICFTEEINLFDYLNGASQGGTFLDADNGNMIIPDGIRVVDTWATIPPGTPIVTTSLYTVGDGIDCLESTAALELYILPEPVFDLQVISTPICSNILDIQINYTYLEGFDFTIEIDGALPELPILIPIQNTTPSFPASDNLDLQLDLTTYNLISGIDYTIRVHTVTRGECEFEIESIPDTFSIGLEEVNLVNDILCGNQTVEYGGQMFDADNPSDVVRVTRPGLCDSIIIVNLIFEEDVTNTITNTLCTGQFITVENIVFNESNPSGTVPILGGASNGCDSTIIVNLTFGDASINNVIQDICSDEELIFNGVEYNATNLIGLDTIPEGSVGGCDSIINVNLSLIINDIGTIDTTICDPLYSITLDNIVFDIDNPQGPAVIANGAVSGCDSMINVNLTFLTQAMGSVDDVICPDGSVVVNGVVFDRDMLTGVVSFNGEASNGCDSIVEVNLTLLEIPEGPFINNSCDLDYSLTVNGTIYNIDNPMGTELIESGAANGCDSIANIQLSFDGINAVNNVVNPDCNNAEGSVVINSINGTAPFFWAQPGDTVVEITEFPYTITGLTGSGALELLDADGCQTSINYSISEYIAPELTYEIINNQISISGISIGEITSVNWTPAEGLSCTDCLVPTISIIEDTEFVITIFYGDDCEISLSVPIMAEEIPIIPEYYIPNVFSPNGDGSNDAFYIVPSETASNQIASMTIFDRWGNQIYRRENYINEIGQGWDGTYNGEELNPGVYVYIIEVLEGEVIKPFYGDVTIVK